MFQEYDTKYMEHWRAWISTETYQESLHFIYKKTRSGFGSRVEYLCFHNDVYILHTIQEVRVAYWSRPG